MLIKYNLIDDKLIDKISSSLGKHYPDTKFWKIKENIIFV